MIKKLLLILVIAALLVSAASAPSVGYKPSADGTFWFGNATSPMVQVHGYTGTLYIEYPNFKEHIWYLVDARAEVPLSGTGDLPNYTIV